jgi:hypothetical protein
MGTDDEWIDVVADTLSELGMIDASTRSALLDSLRDANEHDIRPGVTVLSGGLAGPAPHAADATPPLRVVVPTGLDDDEDDDDDDENSDDDALDLDILRLRRPRADAPGIGFINVDPGETQVIQWRPEPAALRIHCQGGQIEIHADGTLLTLRAGQTMDLCARVIKIVPAHGNAGDPAHGRYSSVP